MTAGASRIGCCLASSADHMQQAIQDNHKNSLDHVWTENHFYEVSNGQRRLSCGRILRSLGCYPIGMLGYLCDTIVKVVLLIGNLLLFLASLFCSCSSLWRKKRGILLLDNLAAIGICVIGIVCPPAAYKLDALAEAAFRTWSSRAFQCL